MNSNTPLTHSNPQRNLGRRQTFLVPARELTDTNANEAKDSKDGSDRTSRSGLWRDEPDCDHVYG